MLTVENTGTQRALEVVQIYVEPVDGGRTRKLAGFATVELDPEQSASVRVELDPRAFMVWDGDWIPYPGPVRVLAGRSVLDIRLDTSYTTTGQYARA